MKMKKIIPQLHRYLPLLESSKKPSVETMMIIKILQHIIIVGVP